MTTVAAVRLSALGDVVHALPAVRALREARPDWEVLFVCQHPFGALLAGESWGVRVVEHDRRGGPRAYLATAAALRAAGVEVALDLQGNFKAAGICWLSRARRRVGVANALRRERASGWLLTERVRHPAPPHPAHAAMAVVRAVAPGARWRPLVLRAGEDEVALERRALERLGLDPDRPLRVFVGGDPGDPRSWRVEAMRRAAARGIPHVVLLGPAEAVLEDDTFPGPVLRHGAFELRRLVALGDLVRRAGGAVLGPDRGATHVLAATGAATTFLYGPQDPLRTAPVGARVLVSKRPPDCAPCRRRTCGREEGPVCMDFEPGEAREVTGPRPQEA